MLAYHNGEFAEAATIGLSIADAGLVYAATVTDFCRTYHQKLFRWPQHLQRFRHDCEALRIPLLHSDEQLTQVAHQLVQHNCRELTPDQELALISFATPGPLGHLLGVANSGPPTLVMHCFPLNSARYQRFFTEGVTLELVGVMPTHPSGLIPFEVKHRSRLNWYLADQRKRSPNSVACLVDERNQAPDTAIGSVLLAKQGKLIRSLFGTVLESISLGVVEDLARELGIPFESKPLGLDDLHADDAEVLLTGSGFGIAGVRELVKLDGTSVSVAWPGPMLPTLQTAWNQLISRSATSE
jgi:branched-chain amino acid aminotransferase